METPTRFQSHLQRGGIGVTEMRRLLEAFGQHNDFERLKQQARQENLLGKTSSHMVSDALHAFSRRFLQPTDLPPAYLVAKAIGASMPEAAKTQILLPYFVCTDPLVDECYRSLVLSRMENPNGTLTRAEVMKHLLELAKHHPELTKWSEYLRVRWARGFLTLLRQFGLMDRHPRTHLRRLYLLPEPFAFFWLWFWQKGTSFWDTARNKVWTLLQLDEWHKEQLLAEGQLRGWWHYQRAGEIVSFVPRFTDAEEWLKNGLA